MIPLQQALAGITAILLDFDGPVCSVFAGYPPAKIAGQMRDELYAAQALSEQDTVMDDPMQILRTAGLDSPAAGRLADQTLARAEAQAVLTAEPTPGAAQFLNAIHTQPLALAIVSNNTPAAIVSYLERQRLGHLVPVVIGRDPNPMLMKPNPELLLRAMRELACTPHTTVMIGDSVTDIEAASAARMRSIGYANKPGKACAFDKAGATAVITSMTELARALTTGATAARPV